jgi:hypothetical protein
LDETQNTQRTERIPRPEQGQTIVEFALVISILFLMVFGIIEFSRLFFAFATMSQGVREGARYGIVHPGQDTAIINEAQSKIVLIGGTATVTVDYPDTVDGSHYCSHKCRIVVEATSMYDAWTPIVPDFEIVAQSTMHIE